jgi:hypothetical protein
MAPPVHPLKKPPPSLHENVFEVPADFEQDEFIAACRSALKIGRTAAEASFEIADTMLQNEMLTLPARHRAARDAIFKASKPAVERIQNAIERIGNKITAMEAFLQGPPAPKDAVGMLAAIDIRRALSGMPHAERRKVIIAALDAGDDTVAVAVLRAPGFVTGLTEDEVTQFRGDWQQRRKPTETAQLHQWKRAAENLERGGTLLVNYCAGLTSNHIIAEAEKSEKRAAAALSSASSAAMH